VTQGFVHQEAELKARSSVGAGRTVRRPASVNLAARPFANTRPLRRVAVALWALGVALLGLAGWLYWRSLFGIEGQKEERAGIEHQIDSERRRLASAESALAGMDLARQNIEATYLNARIGERTFPWSQLFEHLAAVLPKKVRLYSLTPHARDARTSSAASLQRAAALPRKPSRLPDRVVLDMTGSAATDEDLTLLLDQMFKSPWFSDPSLPREQQQNGGIGFALSVAYRPSGRAARMPQPAPAITSSPAKAAPRPLAPPAPLAAASPRPGKRPSTGDEL
jgi:Tfp pilus assembly protein PilN